MSVIRDVSISADALSDGYSLIKRTSCDACKKRKLRCNRTIPSCDACEKRGERCIYPKPRLRKVVPAAYAHGLEQRLANMETHVNGMESTLSLKLSDYDARVLEELFFEHYHHSMPILHIKRYIKRMQTDIKKHDMISLRYIICALSAASEPKYHGMHQRLYEMARQTVEAVGLRQGNQGCDVVLVQVQTWIFIAAYELQQFMLQQAWLSTGRAVRLSQLLKLHCVDTPLSGTDYGTKLEWDHQEERRRAFWACFILDREAGVALTLPMAIEEKDINTILPCPDSAYQASTETPGLMLHDVNDPVKASLISAWAATAAITLLWSRKLLQLSQLTEASIRAVLEEGAFSSNSHFGSIVTMTFKIPEQLKSPALDDDPMCIFTRMMAHSGTIHVAIKARQILSKYVTLPHGMSCERRLRAAAMEIVRLWGLASKHDNRKLPSLTAFCLYNAVSLLAYAISIEPNLEYELAAETLIRGIFRMRSTYPLSQTFVNDLRREWPVLLRRVEKQERDARQQAITNIDSAYGSVSDMAEYEAQAQMRRSSPSYPSNNKPMQRASSMSPNTQDMNNAYAENEMMFNATDLNMLLPDEEMAAMYDLDSFLYNSAAPMTGFTA